MFLINNRAAFKPQDRKRLWLFLPVMTLWIVFPGCFSSRAKTDPPLLAQGKIEIEYRVSEVGRGDIAEKLEVRGEFVARERISLDFGPVGGYLKEIHVHNGNKVQAGELLAELDTGILDLQYEMERLALERARLLYQKETGPEVNEWDRELASIRLTEQIYRTEEAENHQRLSHMTAPTGGTIVYRNSQYRGGDYIPPHTTILQMSEPGNLEILYQGRSVKSFYYGMIVDYRIPVGSNREDIFKAEVVQTPKETPEKEDLTFKGKVYLRPIGEKPVQIRRGTMCNITLVKVEKHNVLILPDDLVETRHDGSFVKVLTEDNRTVVRMIQTGIEDSGMIEVVAGLEEGDLVLNR